MQFPTLETPRLLLRSFRVTDESALVTLLSDWQVMRLYGGGVTQTPEQTQNTLNYHLNCRQFDYWAWAIADKEDDRFIGSLTAAMTDFDGTQWFEPAWILNQVEWNKGFATEAAHAVVEFAQKELGSTRLLVTTHVENRASARVAGKVGFVYLRSAEIRKGRMASIYTMSTCIRHWVR